MPDLKSQSSRLQTCKKAYQAPTAVKTRLDNIVAGQGSCNFDLTGLRDQSCKGDLRG